MHTYIPERETGHGEAWGDGEDGEQREGEKTTEHTRETRERGRRRKGRGQCRRTEPEALKSREALSHASAFRDFWEREAKALDPVSKFRPLRFGEQRLSHGFLEYHEHSPRKMRGFLLVVLPSTAISHLSKSPAATYS